MRSINSRIFVVLGVPRRIFAVLILVAPSLGLSQAFGATYTEINFPGAQHTWARGISGSNIVGTYQDASGSYHGYFYDGTSFTTLDVPFASETSPNGVSGSTVVGSYLDSNDQSYGFVYDGSSFTTIDHPLATHQYQYYGTRLLGISGSTIIGGYAIEAFVFDGATFVDFDYPSPPALYTVPLGIDGETIVGIYEPPITDQEGFIYDGTTFRTLNVPFGFRTTPSGVSGNLVVGWYSDSKNARRSFIYDGSSFETFSYPLPGGGQTTSVQLWGVSGNRIVGNYRGADMYSHAFVATIPEPSSFLLAIPIAVAVLAVIRRRATH